MIQVCVEHHFFRAGNAAAADAGDVAEPVDVDFVNIRAQQLGSNGAHVVLIAGNAIRIDELFEFVPKFQ